MRAFFYKCNLILLAFLLSNSPAIADTTDISGAVSGLWDSRHLEYHISGDIYIPAESSLTIMATDFPIAILFEGHYEFRVEENALLRINVNVLGDTAEYVVSLYTPSINNPWKGLRISKADSATIIYNASFQYADESAIWVDSSNCIIAESEIATNPGGSAINGGGIYCQFSDIIIQDCLLKDNMAGKGGGLYCYKSNIWIDDNIFYYNIALGGNGGGAYFARTRNGEFKNNLFLRNRSAFRGGGIAFLDTSNITIKNTTFHKNLAEDGGAIVSTFYSQPTLVNCILWKDSTIQVNGNPEIYVTSFGQKPIVRYSDLSDTTGYYHSTNISIDPRFVNESPNLLVADFNLSWNGKQTPADSLNMSPCIDTGDPTFPKDPDSTRADMGAFPYFHPFNLLGTVSSDTTLADSLSPFYLMADFTVRECSLKIEPGVRIQAKYSTYNDTTDIYGITIDSAAVLIADGTDSAIVFTRHDTGANWKGIKFSNADSNSYLNNLIVEYADSSALMLENSGIMVCNSLFYFNNGINGGAISAFNSTVICSTVAFNNNKAANGGGIYGAGGSLKLYENIFEGDTASADGGAIYLIDISDVALKRNIFDKNKSGQDGGAVFCSTFVQLDRTKFTNNTFYRNYAGNLGGGVYGSDSSAFEIKNCIFWENTAFDFNTRHIYTGTDSVSYSYCDLSPDAAAEDDSTNINEDPLFIDAGTGDFNLRLGSPCIERGDTAVVYYDPDGTYSDIGAKYFYQGMKTLCGDITSDSTLDVNPEAPDTFKVLCDVRILDGASLTIPTGVTLNFMRGSKMEVFNTGKLMVNSGANDSLQVRFTSFDTTNGWGGMEFNNTDSSTVNNSLIEYVKTTAVKLDSCANSVIIDGCRFQYNNGGTGPGAILANGGNPTILNNYFWKNKCQSNGGALRLINDTDARIERNIFRQNSATNAGGAVYMASCADSLSFFNNTICGNKANSAGALYINDCSPLVLNNIMWHDSANFNQELYAYVVIDSPTVDYCDIEGGYTGGGDSIISLDPLFADIASGDFQITWENYPIDDVSKSPCIDAGYPDSSWLDEDSTRLDIGAICFNQVFQGLPYLPGDVNMYNGTWPPAAIGSDATYLINYFRGFVTSVPCNLNGFWAAADANGDCSVIGSDVTKIVNFLRGTGTIEYCPEYPPLYPPIPPTEPSGWPNCDTLNLVEP